MSLIHRPQEAAVPSIGISGFNVLLRTLPGSWAPGLADGHRVSLMPGLDLGLVDFGHTFIALPGWDHTAGTLYTDTGHAGQCAPLGFMAVMDSLAPGAYGGINLGIYGWSGMSGRPHGRQNSVRGTRVFFLGSGVFWVTLVLVRYRYRVAGAYGGFFVKQAVVCTFGLALARFVSRLASVVVAGRVWSLRTSGLAARIIAPGSHMMKVLAVWQLVHSAVIMWSVHRVTYAQDWLLGAWGPVAGHPGLGSLGLSLVGVFSLWSHFFGFRRFFVQAHSFLGTADF